MNPWRRLAHLLSLGTDPEDMERFRRTLFMGVLLLGALLAIATAALQSDLLRPEMRLPVQLYLLAWSAAHVPMFRATRRADLRRLYLFHLFGSLLTLGVVIASVQIEPIGILGVQLAYHAACLVEAMLLLPFADFAKFVGVSSAFHGIATVLRLPHRSLTTDLDLLAGTLIPLAAFAGLTLMASRLLERLLLRMTSYQQEISRQNEHLEAEVSRRAAAMEAQQQQILQMQKMEALGTLAGGVAHDFNNLLTAILGFASEIRLLTDQADEVHQAAQVIERAGQRAAVMTRQLLGMARMGKQQSVGVDLHKLVNDVAQLLSRTLDKRIEVELDLAASPPVVQGDPGQLQQVVLNLAVNARDAMPEGGRLLLRTGLRPLGLEGVPAVAGLAPGRYLSLSVEDSGTGIPADIRGRIFEPFFTTKGPGKGTGLGLAVVYGIVRNHGGTIELDSEVGRGTRFEILLPAGANLAAEPQAPCPALERAKGRILVVDDEEVVRATAQQLLRIAGYQVEVAGDGQEAVDYFRQHGAELDLVLLDIDMPRLDGLKCLEQLRALRPSMKALMSTGQGLNEAARSLVEAGTVGYLEKPYTQAQLAEAVREAMR